MNSMHSYVRNALSWCYWCYDSVFQCENVSALKGKPDNSQKCLVTQDGKKGHSPCLSTSPVAEEEDRHSLQETPQEMQFQNTIGFKEKNLTPCRLQLILLGKTGTGKSATGNSILGRHVFETKVSTSPVTKAFQRGSREWAGKEIEVIDTPDILSPHVQPEVAAEEIHQALSSPGPHAVLLVIQLGRFTEQDQQTVRCLEKIFGEGILAYTILVFTRKEDLDGDSLDDYVRETDNRSLAELDVKCSRRHCGFNNRAQGPEQEVQLQDLMEKIDLVMWENDGHCYKKVVSQCSQQNILLHKAQECVITQDHHSE